MPSDTPVVTASEIDSEVVKVEFLFNKLKKKPQPKPPKAPKVSPANGTSANNTNGTTTEEVIIEEGDKKTDAPTIDMNDIPKDELK